MSERSISPFEKFGAARPVEDAILQTHVFVVTDSISALAQKYLGDWHKWRLIAERNDLTDVRQIAVGTILIIPRIPLKTGRYESI